MAGVEVSRCWHGKRSNLLTLLRCVFGVSDVLDDSGVVNGGEVVTGDLAQGGFRERSVARVAEGLPRPSRVSSPKCLAWRMSRPAVVGFTPGRGPTHPARKSVVMRLSSRVRSCTTGSRHGCCGPSTGPHVSRLSRPPAARLSASPDGPIVVVLVQSLVSPSAANWAARSLNGSGIGWQSADGRFMATNDANPVWAELAGTGRNWPSSR